MFGTFTHILRNDGLRGLYNGVRAPSALPPFSSFPIHSLSPHLPPPSPPLQILNPPTQLSASLLRQITYSTTRFGVYEELKSLSSTPNPSLPSLILMASTSGFLGGLAGNPADVLNVRMQHDAALPAAQRRNYANAIDGLVRMTREEGVRSLFRGVWPNSLRAVLMTASQLASYDFLKTILTKRASLKEDHPLTHFLSSVGAGFVATTICSPVDVIKTRIMSAEGRGGAGVLRLLGSWYRAEGVKWLFKGWVPSFVRLGPHTVVTFLFLEQHKRIWRMVNHTKVD